MLPIEFDSLLTAAKIVSFDAKVLAFKRVKIFVGENHLMNRSKRALAVAPLVSLFALSPRKRYFSLSQKLTASPPASQFFG
ncbi:MAG: hypothetical protein WCY59_09375 [Anaerovoracaceae bacterium]